MYLLLIKFFYSLQGKTEPVKSDMVLMSRFVTFYTRCIERCVVLGGEAIVPTRFWCVRGEHRFTYV